MKAVKCPECGARLVDEYCVWGHGIFGERAEAARRDYWGDDNDSGSEDDVWLCPCGEVTSDDRNHMRPEV